MPSTQPRAAASAEISRNSAEGLRQTAETNRIALHNKWSNPEAIATTLAPESPATAEVVIGAEKVTQGIGVPEGHPGRSRHSRRTRASRRNWVRHRGRATRVILGRLTGQTEKGDTGDIGPKGDKGDTGTTAFESAQIGGYTGSLPDFYADLARLDNMPPETWAEFQSAVRNGTIDRYFAVAGTVQCLKGANLMVFAVDMAPSTTCPPPTATRPQTHLI